DAFISAMCAEPWGRLSFARTLIEVTAEKELKHKVTMVVPVMDGEGHAMEKMEIEYDWKPPQCSECLVFGHANEQCTKRVKEVRKEDATAQSDGFTTVQNRKKKGKKAGRNQTRPAEGFKVNKPNYVWNPKNSKAGNDKTKDDSSKLVNHNLFDVLNAMESVNEMDESGGGKEETITVKDKENDSDYESKVEEMNIRGLNRTPKQSEVRQVVSENQLSVCAILESHVDINTLATICSKVFQNWEWTSNANLSNKGCRIILGWNKDVVDVIVMAQTNHVIHAKVIHRADQKAICCTFIYAGNDPRERRVLWADLSLHKRVVRGLPWVLLGDFNVALNMEDIYTGSSSMNSAMFDFKDCVRSIKVTQKMKILNKPLRKLMHDQGNLHDKVNRLRFELDEVQKSLDRDPSNSSLRDEEAVVCTAIHNLFSNGKLLKEINHTFLALIPKVATPFKVNDYRPISCCNVIYKCISKILTNRIIEGIKEVVSENQSAFVPGRRISDNILITQELMHNYHRNRGSPRCAFKVDIQKAYDMVD
ncbi:putative RNA-directed DNA polymerase, eukaryota, reverse transcriptase zinc-binding domain protein, partial [Tanacetum coccineum]